MVRLSCLFDLLDDRFANCIVEPFRGKSEGDAFIRMVTRYHGPKKTIFTADRGYEAWNVVGCLIKLGFFCVMRVKDPGSPGGIAQGLGVERAGEYDKQLRVELSRSRAKSVKALAGYRRLSSDTRFDYFDAATGASFPMDIRVVRIKLENGEIETLVTNLSHEFDAEDLKEAYWQRWGIMQISG